VKRSATQILRWLAIALLGIATAMAVTLAGILAFLLFLTCCAAWACFWPASLLWRWDPESPTFEPERIDPEDVLANVRLSDPNGNLQRWTLNVSIPPERLN
jgi:uncharacterized membrane protein YccF (DUF307 family)